MKTMIVLFLFILTVSISSAQSESADRFILQKEVQPIYTLESFQSFAPSVLKGRFIITPDDNGKLNFDTALAIRFQTALETEFLMHPTKGGLNAAVLIPDKGIWQGSIGISTETPLDSLHPNMLWNIGSNTKTFIAVLILQLMEEGKIALDDSIYKYLPKHNFIDSTVTIRQLLNMHSGMYDFVNDAYATWTKTMFDNPLRRWTPEETLTQFVVAPGHSSKNQFRYCSTNLIVAGMIIEKITGKSIATLLHEKIFKPLDLSKTYLPMDDTLSGTISHGWWYGSYFSGWKDLSSVPIDSRVSSMWACGAIYSTTENMTRWLKKLYHNEILQPSSMAEMVKIYDSTNTIGPYGLCSFQYKFYDMLLQGHRGAIYGSVSSAMYDTKSGIAFVIQMNEDDGTNLPPFEVLYHAYLQSFKPYLSVNTNTISIPANNGKKFWDTTVVVKNIGGAFDSVYARVVPTTSEPESTYTITPKAFIIQPGDSQIVKLRVRTDKWLAARYHVGRIMFDAIYAYGQKHLEKQFQIVYTLDIKNGKNNPTTFSLSQNYPNPFNPATVISYQLPVNSYVTVKVYDLLGREVAVLVNEKKDAGTYSAQWDAHQFSSGIYFYRLQAGLFTETKKMILMK